MAETSGKHLPIDSTGVPHANRLCCTYIWTVCAMAFLMPVRSLGARKARPGVPNDVLRSGDWKPFRVAGSGTDASVPTASKEKRAENKVYFQ